MFSFQCIFSKEHTIGFRGSVIIEKQYLIVKIARSNQSQVLKNLLNGGERDTCSWNLKKYLGALFEHL